MTDKTEATSALIRRYPAGAVLFEENDPGSRMYVIRSGRVRIYRKGDESEIVLAVLGPGEFFGEMALLEDLPRSANAQAVDPVELIEVDAETFGQMLRHNSEVAVRMMRKLASRVRELDSRLQNLLVDGGVGRSIEILRWLLPKGTREGNYVRLDASVVHIGIAAQAGIPPHEVQKVYERLRAAGCIKEDGADVLVADNETLDSFSRYLDLKRRYHPAEAVTHTEEVSDKERQNAIQRLLQALDVDAEDLENHKEILTSQYKQYRDLRQRFEFGRGTDG